VRSTSGPVAAELLEPGQSGSVVDAHRLHLSARPTVTQVLLGGRGITPGTLVGMASETPITTPLGSRRIARLSDAGEVDHLPYSIKVLLEAALRYNDGKLVTDADVATIAAYDAHRVGETEIPFIPGRVVLQDFTGVPAVVDLAAMRAAIVRMTGDPDAAEKVNPGVPCDLVVDHSVQVDAFNSPDALVINSRKEFERNEERYEFLKWGQSAFRNFRVVPPATGIVHQVNLEYLAKVVWDDGTWLYPDSLVGTDSHTTMINGLGVVGWGVGGIEAEAAMLGQPISMLLPEVVGFRLTGKLREGATATDLVLRVTEMLRAHGVVGKFVEFHGPGLTDMPLANRATIANMAPEYGATIGFFPVDDRTLDYLRLTGRPDVLIDTIEWYCREQGLWRDDNRVIEYSSELELDMSTVEPALAGPKRPQDRIDLSAMQTTWHEHLGSTFGRETGPISTDTVAYEGAEFNLTDGDVVIAAITSCTNTSNPDVMMAAGLVARKAKEKGITRKPWVKTSLAPGSQVVTEYLESANLLDDLEAAGFYTVGYGCTTCIGNSGPLPDEISAAINISGLVATSVLSGNRNFEGRISPDVRANYLASPPLVVAYALAGTVNWDPNNDPFPGTDVYLRDVWPTQAEIDAVVSEHVTRRQFVEKYADVFSGAEEWQSISTSGGALYDWRRILHLRSGAALLREPRSGGEAARSHRRGQGPGQAGRFGDHRPHLAGRLDQGRLPGRSVPHLQGGAAGDVQLVRLAPGQRPGDDPRDVRQHPGAEPARPRHRRWRDHRLPRRPGEVDLRGLDELPGRRGAAGGPRRQGLRHGLEPRLGGQGHVPAGSQGGAGRELRAHPSFQPGDDGRASPRVPRR
jgi:aconitate hydratase